jgi:hypothetical protein
MRESNLTLSYFSTNDKEQKYITRQRNTQYKTIQKWDAGTSDTTHAQYHVWLRLKTHYNTFTSVTTQHCSGNRNRKSKIWMARTQKEETQWGLKNRALICKYFTHSYANTHNLRQLTVTIYKSEWTGCLYLPLVKNICSIGCKKKDDMLN